VAVVLDRLRRRLLMAANEDEAEDIEHRFSENLRIWHQAAQDPIPPLNFSDRSGRQFRGLMGGFDNSEAVWPTLNSMRHVDGETPFYIRGRRV
jgi:hypothetical protein